MPEQKAVTVVMPTPDEVQKAMYAAAVQLLFGNGFTVNLNEGDGEMTLAIGIKQPPERLPDGTVKAGSVTYTHRWHMPLVVGAQLRYALNEVFENAEKARREQKVVSEGPGTKN